MAKKQPPQATAVRTRRAIIQILKQEGHLDAETLASRLDVTAMAVRQHLYVLQAEQLVTYQEEPRPMGRPVKRWQLTPAADRFFPEGYAELTLGLLDAVQVAFGEAGLEQLLEVRMQQQIAVYRQQMQEPEPATKTTSTPTLEQRLQQLAALRTNEGYMAEVQPQADGSFLFVENHCPICAAATACTGLCAKELETFQTILGDAVNIQRVEHLLAGARRCVYQVECVE
ncbi:MAG: metalloregulator ArsR/SmtB family transcription factor [Leptolyngbyaceae cyanobacterium bins.349]|nr:metalloregulator ArsR/SmtB family transcription factor [Leptolyngbyaceae cyanobacterium bins.349]